AEQACAWLRSLTLNLKYAAFELLYLPAGPIPDNGRGWTPPFARLLNRTAPREQWEWVALFTSSPRIRILDLAVRDGENFEWKAAARTPELTRQVVTGIENNHPAVLRETVVSGIGLAAGGAAHPAARHRLVQIAQWLQLVFDLSAHLKYCSPETDRLHLYEAVLQFDESLLQCRDLQDVMTSTVEHVCRIGGFRRSALFWYTPLTRTVEGVHAFNLRKEDILRIREPADNLSGVQEVVKTTKPVYFENVTHRLPDHYVKTFRLTSLVACPITVSPQRPTAILLLDQDGMPFHPDERTITLLDTLLSRVSKTIHARLLGPLTKTEIPSSSVLTRREQQILQLIADGLDTKEISKHLHLSEYTVSEYVGT
ncbi:MAG: hypothetical protein IRY98_13015, partial [Alicyclobacillaceae bacterium]|nr:hypothetical protein [Alicyclobacillaceae bacterium]